MMVKMKMEFCANCTATSGAVKVEYPPEGGPFKFSKFSSILHFNGLNGSFESVPEVSLIRAQRRKFFPAPCSHLCALRSDRRKETRPSRRRKKHGQREMKVLGKTQFFVAVSPYADISTLIWKEREEKLVQKNKKLERAVLFEEK